MKYTHYTAPNMEALDDEINRLVKLREEHEQECRNIQAELNVLMALKNAGTVQKNAGL